MAVSLGIICDEFPHGATIHFGARRPQSGAAPGTVTPYRAWVLKAAAHNVPQRRTGMRVHGVRAVAAALLTIAGAAAPLSAQTITDNDLAQGLSDPTRWLVVSGDYKGQRLSPAAQITPANAGQLAPQWTFQTNVMANQFEATAIVIDGVAYYTGS